MRLFKAWDSRKSNYIERPLELGDNVIINNTIYRVMEDVINEKIVCAYNDPDKPHDFIVFHENHIDKLLWTEYVEY
jgi:hypothetical protein